MIGKKRQHSDVDDSSAEADQQEQDKPAGKQWRKQQQDDEPDSSTLQAAAPAADGAAQHVRRRRQQQVLLDDDVSEAEQQGDETEAVEAQAEEAGGEDGEDQTDWHCVGCGSDHDDAHDLMLCDGCDAAWHASCLTPPLTAVPEGDWLCPTCSGAATAAAASKPAVRANATLTAPK